MMTYILMAIIYFALLSFADKMETKKMFHGKNIILTIIFVGIWYYLNNFN